MPKLGTNKATGPTATTGTWDLHHEDLEQEVRRYDDYA